MGIFYPDGSWNLEPDKRQSKDYDLNYNYVTNSKIDWDVWTLDGMDNLVTIEDYDRWDAEMLGISYEDFKGIKDKRGDIERQGKGEFWRRHYEDKTIARRGQPVCFCVYEANPVTYTSQNRGRNRLMDDEDINEGKYLS